MSPNRRLRATATVFSLLLTACGGGGSSAPPPPPAAPTITTQPTNQTVNSGATATFSVAASNATSYQWERNGTSISGATGTSYTLSPATSVNNGDSYLVIVTNAGGSTTSAAAVLRVTGVAVLAGQIGGEGYADGPAAQSRFWGPAALALDTAGNLYVADYNAIRKITPAGTVSTILGSPRVCGDTAGLGPAVRLCYPFALAVDGAGNLYVGDGGNFVWQVTPSLVMQPYGSGFNCVSALASYDPLIYVGDGCGTPGGVSTINAGATSAFTNVGAGPAGLSLDAMQNLYVANSTIVQQVTPTGTITTLAGASGATGSADGTGAAARFGCAVHPPGANFAVGNGAVAITTLAIGMSYVADYCNNTIRQVTKGGAVTTIAGDAASPPGALDATTGTSARFWGPTAVVADAVGNLYVADYLNGAIRKVTPTGAVSTYAGQLTHAGYADGAAAQASFRYPYGIAADAAGNLYVADSNNYLIRTITPAGVVGTLAGTPSVAGNVDAQGMAAKFNGPEGIAIDASGNLYVADTQNNSIRKVTLSGAVTTFATTVSGASGSTLAHPTAVALDASGNLYVGDDKGVYKSAASGASALTQVSALHSISAITVAPDGTVYFAQRGIPSSTIYALSPANLVTTVLNTGLSDAVVGIVVAADGNLYVSDRGNSVIKQVTTAGVATVVVGVSNLPIGTVPGGLPARVNSPTGLALLSNSTHVSLAVVDSFEHAVLQVILP
jgi:sugar lactone lactonase YvrE